MASLAPPNSEGFSTAKQPVAWKNGTEISEPFCGRLGSGSGGASPRRRKLRAPGGGRREDVAVDVAMGADGALGLSRGAGGVEDRRVVVRRQGRGRQRLFPPARPSRWGPPITRLQVDHGRVADLLGRAADIDSPQLGTVVQVLGQALIAFDIDHEDRGSGIEQAIFQLRAGPPCVQRRDDRAQGQAGIEGHGPFGQVAHDDGDPVALLNALGRQLRREDGDSPIEGLETDALILVGP